jgi:hypothetical protein
MKKLLFVLAGAVLVVGTVIFGPGIASAQLVGQIPFVPTGPGSASPQPADTSVTITQNFNGPMAGMVCGESGGFQVGFPGNPVAVSQGQITSYQIDGVSVTPESVSWTQTQAGQNGSCPSSLTPNSLPQGWTGGALPYVYQGTFTLNTANLSNTTPSTPHQFTMCVAQPLILGVTSGGNCFGSNFTVQHPVAAPGIGLTVPQYAVTDPVTALASTQTSVENVGGTSMYWGSSPNSATLYNYSPTSNNSSGGGVTSMLPKWLDIANAQGAPLAPGSKTAVIFTYDHRYASTSVPNTAAVNFQCVGSCSPQSAQYTVAYTVPAPSISQFNAQAVGINQKPVLNWTVSDYNYSVYASSAACITGGGFGSGTGTCYPANHNNSGQVLNGSSITGSAQDPSAVTGPTTYTLTLRGLSDVDQNLENFAIQSYTVTPSESPLACTAIGATSCSEKSVIVRLLVLFGCGQESGQKIW